MREAIMVDKTAKSFNIGYELCVSKAHLKASIRQLLKITALTTFLTFAFAFAFAFAPRSG